MRAVIRCKAKQQLMRQMDETSLATIDEALFKEIAATLFRSGHCQAIYQPHTTKAAAMAVEDEIAQELATTYQSIVQQRQSLVVQSLNALL